ncbi:hypothetical protein T459_03519 [Capsicum annuum]|uniref:Tf2-1-like SH3-like domain-containing protein n=1 Tax=Capsicum annuum TaxID=4072 RepID=A0A2G3AN22_CAPAN|nr:hypothetical protein T459_03519 [Capsicum annuum]
MEFKVGEQVLLKVSPIKGVINFGKRGKLIPWYFGPFEVLENVGLVAYRFALPQGMLGFHPIFHVSMLKRYHEDGDYIIKWGLVLLYKDLAFEEKLVAIID